MTSARLVVHLSALLLTVSLLLCAPAAVATEAVQRHANVPVEEQHLANGMTLLLVRQPQATTVAVGWMVRSGSADDPPGQTGMSHLIEHMMFKGSRTVGTRDIARELEALEVVDEAWRQKQDLLARFEQASARRRQKLRGPLEEASAALAAAQAQASALAFLGHYSFLYSQQGGTGLNANTYRDLALYYVTLPSEKLELWFWLESDRLLSPVLRQLYKEVQVIQEERRQRIESTPTGSLDEELRAAFWGDHPYGWNPMGRATDLERISRQDAVEFLQTHYRPEAMTAVIVGGFDPVQVRAWARRYLGRLPVGTSAAAANPVQPAPLPSGERRLEASCSCPPQVKVLYPTARFGEPDAYALQLLAAVLNGRTGRLYRSLVLDQQIAFSAFAQQISWRQAGEFSFRAESKGGLDPTDLIRAWDEQLERLRLQPPTAEELERARNRSAADAYRSIRDPTALMKQLLIYQGLGDWRYINHWSHRLQEIDAATLVQVATRYLRPEHRTVAIYRRPAGDEP